MEVIHANLTRCKLGTTAPRVVKPYVKRFQKSPDIPAGCQWVQRAFALQGVESQQQLVLQAGYRSDLEHHRGHAGKLLECLEILGAKGARHGVDHAESADCHTRCKRQRPAEAKTSVWRRSHQRIVKKIRTITCV